MAFEDSPGGEQPSSPFEIGASPVGRRKSSIAIDADVASDSKVREGAKGRAGPSLSPKRSAPTSPAKGSENKRRSSAEMRKSSDESLSAITYEDAGGDDNEDYGDMGGGGDDYMDDDNFIAEEESANKSRRVSFGQDTSGDLKAPLSADSSSSKRGRGRPPKTPDSSMGSTRTTPESARSARSAMSTPGSEEFARGKKVLDETFEGSSDEEGNDRTDRQDTDSDEDDRKNSSGYAEDSFASAIRKRKQYFDDDDEEEEEEEEEDEIGGSRRSKRVTKGKKLAWWKGERPVYDAGRMIGLLTANPTPAKKTKSGRGPKGGTKVTKYDEGELSIVKHEEPIVLPQEVEFIGREQGEELSVWDDVANSTQTLKILCYGESNEAPSALPITAPRPENKTQVGFAAQSFNVPEIDSTMSGWISGFVELPAGAIKDAEGVGGCAQVFFISECQDGALEFGLADPAEAEWKDETAQRQLLKKGDTFFVPPGNIYRLENHSANKSCFIFWTIVKPLQQATSSSESVASAGVSE